MTPHATPRPAVLGPQDDERSADAGPTLPAGPALPAGLLRRVATGTGATLALAVASVTVAGAAQADVSYTVRNGDTVSHIAARTGSSVSAITRANRLANPGQIRIGQHLTIPTAAKVHAAAKPAAKPAARAASASYTVASGDTVSGIAAQHRTSIARIVAANHLDARALIRVGQHLVIPGAGAPAAAKAAASRPAPTAHRAAGLHRVVSGETVSGLAASYRISVASIVAANHLGPHALIRVGQLLAIPGSGASRSAAHPVAAARPTSAVHRVASGETVSAIAARYRTSVAAIVAANHLDPRAFIRVGQNLRIPGAGAPTRLVGNTFAGRTYPEAVVNSANANKAALLRSGVPSRAQMRAKVAATARAMGVNQALAQAVAFQESGFNQAAVSPANAIGTMQVVPSAGAWASHLVGRHLNLLNPNDNVTAGVAILRQLTRISPNLPAAIAGYYQGAASVRDHGMFADTRVYVANIQTLAARYR
ncbi:LysM peptidoglycan-binding domain-containing protein [Pengzhenrongella sp.]|jgi:LysM repeat protein|uniref:LysM peptidoglycan-binding domain-containing protein n=1 Tax=Pengzhenrongella sp. TaxID=2888820 RepID=UPI002F93EC04